MVDCVQGEGRGPRQLHNKSCIKGPLLLSTNRCHSQQLGGHTSRQLVGMTCGIRGAVCACAVQCSPTLTDTPRTYTCLMQAAPAAHKLPTICHSPNEGDDITGARGHGPQPGQTRGLSTSATNDLVYVHYPRGQELMTQRQGDVKAGVGNWKRRKTGISGRNGCVPDQDRQNKPWD